MDSNVIPTYQTTSFKKDDSGAIIYIALASLGAIVILLGALYFMFFNNGEKQVTSTQSSANEGGSNAYITPSAQITETPTPSTQTTNTPTPTPSVSETPTPIPTPEAGTYATNYVFGAFQTSEYKLSNDKTQIIKIADDSVVYTAPSGYTLVSFAVTKPSIFVVLKTPEAYTYEFRKVAYGSNNLGGLFYKYYSAYSMTSFVVDPVNYRTLHSYVILSSLPKKQFLVLDVKDFKEVGKKVVSVPGFAEFKAAYKLADQNAIRIEYIKSDNSTDSVLITFEQ